MATITLTTYINIKKGTKKINKIPSISVAGKKGSELPRHCAFGMYGTKDSLAMLQRVRMANRSKENMTYRIDIKAEVGDFIQGKASLEDIAKTRFVNLQRIKADTAAEILELIRDDTLDDLIGRSDVMSVLSIIGKYPHLLDKLFEDSRFSHIGVIVWPAPVKGKKALNGQPATEQIAAIKPDCISDIEIRNFDGDYESAVLSIND
jgi:hypothetical protein